MLTDANTSCTGHKMPDAVNPANGKVIAMNPYGPVNSSSRGVHLAACCMARHRSHITSEEDWMHTDAEEHKVTMRPHKDPEPKFTRRTKFETELLPSWTARTTKPAAEVGTANVL